uniref:Uncharacterized protein n=1 Tax=Amphimedon queenslandica TaxID=400682 RepID=A0A1X7T5P6_AMPQE
MGVFLITYMVHPPTRVVTMFQEEESELQHNPDDHDCYNRLRASNLDERHATTPKRPKASRKRTWSQESEASAPVNSDL